MTTPPMVILDFGTNYNEDALKSEATNGNQQIALDASSGGSQQQQQQPDNQQESGGQTAANNNNAWPDSKSSLDSGSLERSAPVAGLVYRAPFFTSWFVSIWNILFMPVFTLISSCCFRNEDSTTKKLLV